jgi:hypothetical protein
VQFFHESTVGNTYFFYSFPDSLLEQRSYFLSELNNLTWPDGSVGTIATAFSYAFYEHGADRWYYQAETYYLRPTRDIDPLNTAALGSYCSAEATKNSWYMHFGCVGDIVREESATALEIVFLHEWFQSCWGPPLYPESFDTMGTKLVLQRLTWPPAVEVLWGLDIDLGSVTNLLYHPDYPGYFFAFVDGAFAQFEGASGAVNQATSNVPEGRLHWDYPFGDSTPRLVALNGTELSLYIPDIITGVENSPDPEALPVEFTLGDPYPNPFNVTVTIPVYATYRGHVIVELFNPLGQRVALLYDGELEAGRNLLTWNASRHPSGIYLVRARSATETRTAKIVLLK